MLLGPVKEAWPLCLLLSGKVHMSSILIEEGVSSVNVSFSKGGVALVRSV